MPKVDPETRDIDKFATYIRIVLASRDLPTSALRDITGRSRALVHRWVNGESRITEDSLNLIAAEFDVSPAFLRYGALPVEEKKLADVIELVFEEIRKERQIEDISTQQLALLIATVYEEFVNKIEDAKQDRINTLVRLILAG